MPPDNDVRLDLDRPRRIGLAEAILCAGKTRTQIRSAVEQARTAAQPLLLTRLDADTAAALDIADLDYDPISRTGFIGEIPPTTEPARIAIVTAGSSDLPTAAEAARTLAFYGHAATSYADVGVAGLWRLLEIKDALAEYPAIIAVAGMEGALFSVLGGLVPGLIVAVPTSTGYGVARLGETALNAALTSCAQGVVAVNIENGFGAACAVMRALRAQGPGDSVAPSRSRAFRPPAET